MENFVERVRMKYREWRLRQDPASAFLTQRYLRIALGLPADIPKKPESPEAISPASRPVV